jgi:xylulose-5-phosphate/fructose-6-phosphate phosphoketolase
LLKMSYYMSHAHGAAFHNPGLIVGYVIGDGEAQTGPLATSWDSHRFVEPASDGEVLPALALNGWKIANPAVLARLPESELDALLRGYEYEPLYVSSLGDPPPHQEMAATLDDAIARIRIIQDHARHGRGHLARSGR